ncbi:hypothetical protein JXL19_02640 [bacterium]|nr:hypothetical protein [bacterium]
MNKNKVLFDHFHINIKYQLQSDQLGHKISSKGKNVYPESQARIYCQAGI